MGPRRHHSLHAIGTGDLSRVSSEAARRRASRSWTQSRRERNHFWPEFLPDGRHFLYMATALDANGAARDAHRLRGLARFDRAHATGADALQDGLRAAWVLAVRAGGRAAGAAFDAADLRTERRTGHGSPKGSRTTERSATAQLRGVRRTACSPITGAGDPSGSSGTIGTAALTESGWPTQGYGEMRISPDGQRVAVDVVDPRIGTSDIWIYDVSRGAPIRFTSDLGNEGRAGVGAGWTAACCSDRIASACLELFIKTFGGTEEGVDRHFRAQVAYPESRRTGPATAVGSPTCPTLVRPSGTCGSCRSTAIENRGRSPHAVRGVRRARSRRTRPGWRSCPTNPARPEVYVAPGRTARRQTADLDRRRHDAAMAAGRTELYYASAGNRSIMVVPVELGATMKAGTPDAVCFHSARSSPRARARGTSPMMSRRTGSGFWSAFRPASPRPLGSPSS